jgi:hypothetical protein
MEVHWQQPSTLPEHITAFTSAVDFSEPFILGLLAFDLSFWLCVLVSIWRPRLQTPLFFGALLLAGCLEWINNACARHWRLLAKQNYFDQHGLFFSVMLGAPLVVGAFVILV